MQLSLQPHFPLAPRAPGPRGKHGLRATRDVIQDHELDCINGTVKTDMKRGCMGENILDRKNLRKSTSKCTTRN